jgi:hypothetical protein
MNSIYAENDNNIEEWEEYIQWDFRLTSTILHGNLELARLLIDLGVEFSGAAIDYILSTRRDDYWTLMEFHSQENTDIFIKIIHFLSEFGMSSAQVIENNIHCFILKEPIKELFVWLLSNVDISTDLENTMEEVSNLQGNHMRETFEILRSIGAKFTINHFENYACINDRFTMDTDFTQNIRDHVIENNDVNFFILIGLDHEVFSSPRLAPPAPEYYVELFRQTLAQANPEYIRNLLLLRPELLLSLCDEDVLKLLSQIEDVNVQNRDGNTLMHLAVKSIKPNIAEVISNKLVNLNAKNSAYQSPNNLLKNFEDQGLVKLFQNIFNKIGSHYVDFFKNVILKICLGVKTNLENPIPLTGESFTKVYLGSYQGNLSKISASFQFIAEYLGKEELERLANPQLLDNIRTHDVHHDGNCFFHVMAANTDIPQEEIRAGAIEQILNNVDRYEGFTEDNIDSYIDGMSKSSTWADNVIIQAVADRFGWSIEILNHQDYHVRNQIIPIGTAQTQHIIAIYTGNHYYAGYRDNAEPSISAVSSSEILEEEANQTFDDDVGSLPITTSTQEEVTQQHNNTTMGEDNSGAILSLPGLTFLDSFNS